MAEVMLAIGGRQYTITCRDGGEDHLRGLARAVDAKVDEARSAAGSASEVRQLLFAALLLADDLAEAGTASANAKSDLDVSGALETLALRVEALADALETAPQNA